jgi:hypothetical protein
MTLVGNQVPEAFDLDFKSEMYGGSDREKRDAATDVAALANTAGGLIVLGIAEDAQARATAAPGVALAEAGERRIRQIIGSQVVPMPIIDVFRVEDPDKPGHGFVLLAVARSPLAPHAVLINDGLRFPRRNGATTRYLSEPEVAAAYRERFATARRQPDRAREVEASALEHLSTVDDQVWTVISLVPDLAGDLMLDQAALSAAREALVNQGPLIMPSSLTWKQVNIGPQRLLADGSHGSGRMARWLSADLYSDGSGVFAAHVLRPDASPAAGSDSPEPRSVVADSVVNCVLSGLRFLARHARDHAAAGGNALIRAQLYPVSQQQPLQLCQYQRGFMDTVGTRTITTAAPVSESTAPLDALAIGGVGLVSAAYLLTTGIFQAFGCAEAAQLTRDGEVRPTYWNPTWQRHLQPWTDSAGIRIV